MHCHFLESSDEEFDGLEGFFEQLHGATTNLLSDAISYRTAVRALLEHQAALHDLVTANGYAEKGLIVKQLAEQRLKLLQLLDEVVEGELVHALREFDGIMKTVKSRIVKRSHKLLDVTRLSQPTTSSGNGDGKTTSTAATRTVGEERKGIKNEQALEQAKRDYELHSRMLKSQLPMLFELRQQLISPCIESILYLQGELYRLTLQSFERASGDLKEVIRKFDEDMIAVLKEMQQISVVADMLPKRSPMVSAELSPDATSSAPSIYPSLRSDRPAVTGQASGSLSSIKSALDRSGAKLDGIFSTLGIGSPSGTTSTEACSVKSTSSASASNPAAASTPKLYAVADYDFAAEQQGDLSLRTGQRIEVLAKGATADSWWEGKAADGRVGSFPGNYVRLIPH